jgi:hypothetical protein
MRRWRVEKMKLEEIRYSIQREVQNYENVD